jgi:hypothetical protein
MCGQLSLEAKEYSLFTAKLGRLHMTHFVLRNPQYRPTANQARQYYEASQGLTPLPLSPFALTPAPAAL